MYVVNTIPLVSLPRTELQTLTYFFDTEVPFGALVEGPLGKRSIRAVAVECTPLEEKKIDLKRASYRLKGLTRVISSLSVLSKSEFAYYSWISEYFFEPLGIVLRAALPATLLEKNVREYESKDTVQGSGYSFTYSTGTLRLAQYTERLHKNILQDRQTLLLFPEVLAAENFFERLPTHIKDVTLLWTSTLTPHKELEARKKLLTNDTKVVIGARSAALLHLPWIAEIIVEDEANPAHKSWEQHPKYDARALSLYLARERQCALSWGGDVPSVRAWWMIQKESVPPLPELSRRTHEEVSSRLIDMREELKSGNKTGISGGLLETLKTAKGAGEQAILLVNRRGEYTIVLCRDCGYVLTCPRCDLPLITFQSSARNISVPFCRYCGKKREVPVECPQCKGTRFRLLGSGSERVTQELLKQLSDLRIARLDSDTARTKNLEEEIVQDFIEKRADVLLGTQMIVKPHILPRVYLTGIINMEAALFLPEYNGEENTFILASELRDMSREHFLWQTYRPNHRVFEFLFHRSPADFLDAELALRKELSWPPYTHLIKISIGAREAAESMRSALVVHEKLSRVKPKEITLYRPLPSRIPRVRDRYISLILIKADPSLPVVERNKFLSYVPTKWEVEIDPLNTLS